MPGMPVTARNYINGQWVISESKDCQNVVDPATGEAIGIVGLSTAQEVDSAVRAAAVAFESWRRTPPEDRIQPLFKLKAILETHVDELARMISRENGKTLTEAKGELR